MLQYRIPGYALDLICRCGREATLYERVDEPPWIEAITLADLPRYRCRECGGHPVEMRRRWQPQPEWSSSN